MRISTALVGVLIGVPIFLPIIMQPHNASDLILHGTFLMDIAILAIVLAGMYFMKKNYTDRTFADEKEKKLAGLDMTKKVVNGACGIMFVAFSALVVSSAVKDAEIKNHGERVMANVLDIYMGSCGKHGCREYVKYQFTPKSAAANSQPITDSDDIANSDDVNNPRLVFAQTRHQVPVAYDARDPQVSTLNFNDIVFQRDPMKFAMGMVGFLGVTFLILAGILYWTVS